MCEGRDLSAILFAADMILMLMIAVFKMPSRI
jgi:hypothetical protein